MSFVVGHASNFVSLSVLYCHCNNYMFFKKKVNRQMSMTSLDSGFLIGCNWFIYTKYRIWCNTFHSFWEQYLCFVVFCLMFLITVDTQRQLFHSITTASDNINCKKSSKSLHFPQVIKQFRCECLWHHS